MNGHKVFLTVGWQFAYSDFSRERVAKKVDSGNGSDCDDKQTSITIVDSSYSDYSRKFARLARSKPRRNRDLKTLTVLPPGPLHRLSTSHDLRRAHISTSQFDGGDVYKEERAEPQLFYPRPWLGIAVGVHCQCHEEKHCTWIGLSSSCAVMRHSRFGIFWADNGRNLKPAVLEPLNNLLFSRLSGTFAPKTAITILLSILQRVLACLTQYIPPFHQYPVYPFGPSPLSLSTIPQ